MEKHRQEAIALLSHETNPAKRRALIEQLAQAFRSGSEISPRERHQVGEAIARLLPVASGCRAWFFCGTHRRRQGRAHLSHPSAGHGRGANSGSHPLPEPGSHRERAPRVRGKRGEPTPNGDRQTQQCLPEASSRIVESGDAAALTALVRNSQVTLTTATISAALARAKSDETLAETLAARPDVPVASLADLFHVVSGTTRAKLLRALEERPDAAPSLAAPLDDAEARFVQAVRAGDRPQMLAALRRGFHLSPAVAESALRDESCETLAAVALAVGLSRAAYSTFVVLSHAGEGTADAMSLYDRMSVEGARRLVAAWQAKAEASPSTGAGEIWERSPPPCSVRRITADAGSVHSPATSKPTREMHGHEPPQAPGRRCRHDRCWARFARGTDWSGHASPRSRLRAVA